LFLVVWGRGLHGNDWVWTCNQNKAQLSNSSRRVSYKRHRENLVLSAAWYEFVFGRWSRRIEHILLFNLAESPKVSPLIYDPLKTFNGWT